MSQSCRLLATLLALALALAAARPMASPAPEFRLFAIGEAWNPASGELLYREYHLQAGQEPTRVVEYRQPGGTLIASKTVHYGDEPAAPGFIQLDLRSGHLLSAHWQEGGLLLTRRPAAGSEPDSRVVERPAAAALVIDAGFDDFIRLHWDSLRRGETREFEFAFPARLGLVTLQAKAAPCGNNSSDLACFRVQPANGVLRLLVEPIQLAYTAADRRLARFQGMANIDVPGSDGDLVAISYSYPGDQALPGCQPMIFRTDVPPPATVASSCQLALGD